MKLKGEARSSGWAPACIRVMMGQITEPESFSTELALSRVWPRLVAARGYGAAAAQPPLAALPVSVTVTGRPRISLGVTP